jgi:hypothetical protein
MADPVTVEINIENEISLKVLTLLSEKKKEEQENKIVQKAHITIICPLNFSSIPSLLKENVKIRKTPYFRVQFINEQNRTQERIGFLL